MVYLYKYPMHTVLKFRLRESPLLPLLVLAFSAYGPRNIIPHSEQAHVQPELEDKTEDEHVQSDKSESDMESEQDVGGGTATTVQAPPAHATERNWEFDIPFDEIEAPLGKSLSETTSTAASSLLAGNRDAFIWDAVPTRTGRLRRMRDMAEVHACICGSVVSEEEIKENSAVIECAHRGCETRYFHLRCADLEYAPKNWRCDNHKLNKRARR